jgi:muramoyltetrapeptide carboxypeptidase
VTAAFPSLPSAQSAHHDALLSTRLRPGDRVRLVSPASFPSAEWLDHSVGILKSWDLEVEVGDHALEQWGYMAGRDQDRLDDLNNAFRDKGIRAVITTQGGAGADRIADGIDFEAVRADPKPVVGFSDITNLHLALWRHCRLAGIHGCLAGKRAAESVRQLLMTTHPTVLYRDPQGLSASIEVAGAASGTLLGGNLRSVAYSVGAGLPSLEGAILFLEDQRTAGLAQVDRPLNQLIRSHSLQGVKAIALGRFSGFDDHSERGWTVIDVLQDRLCRLGIPVLGGLDLGHGMDSLATPLGSAAYLDTRAGTLTVEPCVI